MTTKLPDLINELSNVHNLSKILSDSLKLSYENNNIHYYQYACSQNIGKQLLTICCELEDIDSELCTLHYEKNARQ